jgi:chemotaxis protein methyltransferase CheR
VTAGRAAEAFRDWIAARFGLNFDDTRLSWLSEILSRRAGTAGVENYVDRLTPDAASALAQELTVGETFFFRNTAQFEAVREHVIAERLRVAGPTQPLSILSAGCSSGEEPYSIAMLLREALPADAPMAIRAIDLNPVALEKAAVARYGTWALRETSPERLARWFRPYRGEMEVDPVIRAMVTFDLRNLADPGADIWRPAAYDVVFCRNVIMYLTPEVQRAVVARIARSLKPGGYLFLGHAESLRSLSHGFHLVHTNGTFYYRLRAAASVDEPDEIVLTPARAQAPRVATEWHQSIAQATGRVEQLAASAPEAPEFSSLPAASPDPAADIAALVMAEHFAEALARIAALPPAAAADPAIEMLEALLFVHTGRPMAASEACRRILARDEFEPGANYLLGLCLEEAGDAGSALQHYDAAIHLDPTFAMAVLRRGLLARKLGNPAEARADFDQARELIANEDEGRLKLFAGGFSRATLGALCVAELANLGRAA